MKRPVPAPTRDTRQRQAIRHVLDVADRPLSPPEILGHARGAVPAIGLATVYRTLKSLVTEGWLVPVVLPGRPPVGGAHYERAGKAHHHHFHCRGCGGVFEVHGCPGNMKSLAPSGFRLEGHELVLYGVCRGCKSSRVGAAATTA